MHFWIIALLQIAIGVFFASSGWHKLFVKETADKVDGLFTKLGVPKWQQRLVKWGELLGGLGLLFDVLPKLAALGLLLITAGAITLNGFREDVLNKHPKDPAEFLQKCIYMPETLLVISLLAIITAPGSWLEVLIW